MKQPALIQSMISSLSRTFSRRKTPGDPEAFRALFDKFKAVLESNNRALETITDMGEKLGGDYLFDVVYLQKAYARLKGDLEYSLDRFDELTQGRYRKLRGVFDRIDSLVKRVVSGASPVVPQALVIFLENMSWGMTHEAGGKNALLAEVKNQLGLPVPDGFVLTTAAFDEFIRFNRLEDRIERLGQGTDTADAALQELQEHIIHGAVPPEVRGALQQALETLKSRCGACSLAVRSSAEEEDGGHSFAGQFETLLHVPLDLEEVERAYRKVVASLYSGKAVAYQRQTGYEPGTVKMAVGCMVMIDAVSSGVIYSSSPDGGDTLIISAAWGLGESVVEGRTEADVYVVRKGAEPELIRATYGRKDSMIVGAGTGGTAEVMTDAGLRDKPCLTPEQIAVLTSRAMKIERYFGSPRDIEWSVDKEGTIYILQARPLNAPAAHEEEVQTEAAKAGPPAASPVLLQDQGAVVQRGAGAGKVFIARNPDDIDSLAKGAVLVARHDSSLFVRAMPYVSAIITETGSQTSHMAALCRELKVPTVVNMPHATEVLQDGQEITVVAGEDNRTVIYAGVIRDLLDAGGRNSRKMEDVFELRRKRYILRYISPLHLIDPLMDEFTPERCRTMHDILRFIHEKSVAELVESAREGGARMRKRGTVVRLDLPVPAGILVMDLGGGLRQGETQGVATFEQIDSLPFKSIVKGMIHPGAWHSEAVQLTAQDFLSSMMRMPDIASATGSTAGYNVAVVSREYVNMSIRFGYHFNMVDCYMSGSARNNHIYFRFAGGATDLVKRSRRLELIAKILKEFGFNIKIKGDLLIARLAGLGLEEMEKVLDQTGRLIAYARQLDAALQDDLAVDSHVRSFLGGNYHLAEPGGKE